MARFALDEGFPDTIFKLADLLPGIDLVPLRKADPRLVGNSEDWAVVLRVHQLGYDGFLTTDGRMVEEPKVISVLHQTKSTLVAFLETGHDAIRASGLALLHLPHIARSTVPTAPQLWVLRPPQNKDSKKAWDQIGELASRHGISTQQLFITQRLSDEELNRDLWEWYQPGTTGEY
jgi:hypothetical protein